MSQVYGYHKPVHRHHRQAFRRYSLISLLIAAIVGLAAATFLIDLYASNHNPKQPTSPVQNKVIAADTQVFRSTYFQFRDTGTWVLNSKESTDNKFIYYKYHGLQIENQLIVYIDQTPIPLYLTTARVLPVHIVNDNSLSPFEVSAPCGKTYGPSDLHKVKEVYINQTTMLCDPDTPQYSVVLGEIGGNYQLHMKRLDGAPVQLVVTFKDLTLDPKADTIKNIASTFQVL